LCRHRDLPRRAGDLSARPAFRFKRSVEGCRFPPVCNGWGSRHAEQPPGLIGSSGAPWTAANRTQSARRRLWNYRPSKPHPPNPRCRLQVAGVDRDESGDRPIGRRRAISSRVPDVDVWPAGVGKDEHDGAAVSRCARRSHAGHVADWNPVDQVGESPCRVLGEQMMRGERERWRVIQPAVPHTNRPCTDRMRLLGPTRRHLPTRSRTTGAGSAAAQSRHH